MGKSKISFLLIITLIVNVICFIPVSAAEQDEKIRVGYYDATGFISENENGGYEGYGVDYLQEIARYTGWKYEFVKGTWKQLLEKLRTGEIDLLCNAEKSKEREALYEFSKYEAGTEIGLIYAAADAEIYYEDFQAFHNCRVGVLNGSYQETLFLEYARNNHFSYTKVGFDSANDIVEGLKSKTLDLAIAGSLDSLSEEKLVGKFGYAPFYFITHKGENKLMKILNDAMEQLKIERPYLNEELNDLYYGTTLKSLVGTTREEAEFVKNCGTLKVACDPDSYPIEYIDEKTGEYKGIHADALRLISKNSGIRFEYVATGSFEESWEKVSSGELDLISCTYANEENANARNVMSTCSYITADNSVIGRRGGNFDSELELNIAVPHSYKATQYFIKEKYPEWKINTYANLHECLKAVSDGKEDITLMDSIFLQTKFNLNNYRDLTTISTLDIKIPMSIGISEKHPQILKTIMDKAITKISDSAMTRITIENTINIPYHLTIMEQIKENMMIIILIAAVSFSVVFIGLQKKEQKYRKIAMTDSLTGLWSNNKFTLEADAVLNRNKGKNYVVMTLDIDKFKYINDNFGFDSGDRILIEIADKMRLILKDQAFYARNTADRFWIFMEYGEKEKVIEKAEELINISYENHSILKRRFYLPLKVGVCYVDARNRNVKVAEYIDKANIAKSAIKGIHTNNVAVYNQELEAVIEAENEIERNMESALQNGEFIVYYQPKYDLNSEKIIGAEALVRWKNGTNLIPPIQFIPFFEKNGFIIKLDYYVYREVCKAIRNRMDRGERIVPIAVNVSRIHFVTTNFVEKLMAITQKYEIPSRYIELELTESAFADHDEIILDKLNELKTLGFSISIDDFGTGYSSLNLLKQVPVDILKIDKEFLDESADSRRSSIIIEQVVEMAKKINIGTICEGVETQEQATFLKGIGCDMVQGYYYAKPMPLEQFEKII